MIQQHPYYPFVKHLLLSESCRGIVTHMESTAQSLPLLFEAPLLGAKVFHVPWGIFSGSTSARTLCSDTVTILFTNSWHQDPRNFYLRGGLDVLEAFDRLVRRFSFLQLILRTRLPDDLPHRYRKMIDRLHQVKVLPEKLTRESMDNLFAEADVFVLPSARIHVVSILEAMAHGLALVVSDGWGISEYVEDGRTGLIVPGRYGKVSWRDDHGMLREDYTDMMSPDEHFVSKLTQSMKRLVGDAALRQSLGQNAQAVATNQFSLPVWRNNFAAVLETVMNPKNNTAK